MDEAKNQQKSSYDYYSTPEYIKFINILQYIECFDKVQVRDLAAILFSRLLWVTLLDECFVTIAAGFAQNPGPKALDRIPAWDTLFLAYLKYIVLSMPHEL